MDKSLPPAKSLKFAWDACQRARNPSTINVETLVLALLHGAGIGAARAPTTLQEGTEGAHLQAARLFVALQVKLAREPGCLEGVTAGWFEQLVAAIPKSWATALQARMLRPEPTPPATVELAASPSRPTLAIALADMEVAGRA